MRRLLMRTIRTVATRARFLASLRETPNVSLACVNAGISRVAAYAWRDDDEKFAAAWEDALSVAVGYLEEEARRRAVGTGVPVEAYEKPRRLPQPPPVRVAETRDPSGRGQWCQTFTKELLEVIAGADALTG